MTDEPRDNLDEDERDEDVEAHSLDDDGGRIAGMKIPRGDEPDDGERVRQLKIH